MNLDNDTVLNPEAAEYACFGAGLPPAQLSGMRRDPDWRVRYEAASRIDERFLPEMIDDEDPLVRERAAQRLMGAAGYDGAS